MHHHLTRLQFLLLAAVMMSVASTPLSVVAQYDAITVPGFSYNFCTGGGYTGASYPRPSGPTTINYSPGFNDIGYGTGAGTGALDIDWNPSVIDARDNSINRVQPENGLATLLDVFIQPIARAQCAPLVPAPTIFAYLDATPSTITGGTMPPAISTLTWSSSGNVVACTGVNFDTRGATSGSLPVSPTETTDYAIICSTASTALSLPTFCPQGGQLGGYFNPNECGGFTTYNIQETAMDQERVTVVEGSLAASCTVAPGSIENGDSATWTATVSGGTGSYIYSWSGTDALTGTGSSVQKTYTTLGTKTASVQVTSGVQQSTVACTNSLSVTGDVCNNGLDDDGDTRIDGADAGCGDESGGGGGGDGSESTDEPTATLSCTPSNCVASAGQTVELTYTCTRSNSATLTNFGSLLPVGNGTRQASQAGPHQLICIGEGGTANASKTVSLSGAMTSITASPDRVQSGSSSSLTWTTSQCATVSVTKNGAAFSTASSSTNVSSGPIVGQTEFVVSCDGGASTDSVLVNVLPSFDEF